MDILERRVADSTRMNRITRDLKLVSLLALAIFLAAATLGGIPAASPDTTTEANIVRLTATILGDSQFTRHSLDDKLADAFLDRYLDALDTDRSLFLQSDVEDFASYRATLARDTLRDGDDRAAYAIFDRYLERLAQRVQYVTEKLQTATFDFTGHDAYLLDRTQAARPLSLDAAQALWWQRLRFEYLQEKLNGKSPDQIVTSLEHRLKDMLRAMQQLSHEEVVAIYLDALAQVYDPHSDYMGHEDMQEFAISMNLSLFGIGAKLLSQDGYCRIVELIPGGPAARSGLLGPGDRIVAVSQDGQEPVDVVGMPLKRIVELIRGSKGSVVTLSVIPSSAADEAVRKNVRLVRDEIKLEDKRAKAKIIDRPISDGRVFRIGVIDLPSFYAEVSEAVSRNNQGAKPDVSATADVAALLTKLVAENVEGIILDLRSNGGGSLDEAIKLSGLFITEGPVVQTRDPNGKIEVGKDTDPSMLYRGPLIVLTSRFSASASEILAGALQDYGRALIVGDPSTFGKGTVQSILPLAEIMDRAGMQYEYDPGALRLTIRKFYRPSGSSTQLKGVVSDITIPSESGVSGVGESVLENPLPWDSVAPVAYDRLDMVGPYVETLRSESAERVTNEPAFAYIRAESARIEERATTKELSLNEAERRQQLARIAQLKKKYESALPALRAPTSVSYEITVENALNPGLPAPSKETVSGALAPAGGAGTSEGAAEAALGDGSAQREIILDEAERILADYAALLGHRAVSGTMHGDTAASPARSDN